MSSHRSSSPPPPTPSPEGSDFLQTGRLWGRGLKDSSLPLPNALWAGVTFLQGEGQGWGETGTAIGGVEAE